MDRWALRIMGARVPASVSCLLAWCLTLPCVLCCFFLCVLAGVDEAGNVVYVMGTADGPLERHLYAVPLLASAPTPPIRLTVEPGMHTVKIDHQVLDSFTVQKGVSSLLWPRHQAHTVSMLIENSVF